MRPSALLLGLLLGATASAQTAPVETTPTVYDLPDLANATIEALPAPPGPSRAGRLLYAKQYAELDVLLAKARAADRLPESFETWLATHLETITGSRHLAQLDAWSVASPRSAYAWLARGEAWVRAALRIRGADPAKQVSPARWERIRARLRQAEADLQRATKLDPKLARPHALRITVAAGLGQDNKLLVGHFDRSVAADPNDVEAHTRLLQALSPDWGGSWAAMLELAGKCAASGETEPALYYVLGLAHEQAARASKNPAGYLSRPKIREALRPAFKALAEGYPSALPALRLRARLDLLRKNSATRATWRALLADAGDADALFRRGAAAHRDAKQPEPKRLTGLRDVLRAAYLGSAGAPRYAALLLKARKLWKPCAAWLRVAYVRGDSDAAFDLGLLKWRGRGLEQDPRGAVTLWREAVGGARPAVAKKAQKWLEYVLNKRPELLRKKKP